MKTITLSYEEFESLKEQADNFRKMLDGKKCVYYEYSQYPVLLYDFTEDESIKKMADVIDKRDKTIIALEEQIKRLRKEFYLIKRLF